MAYQFFRVGEISGTTFREYNLDFSVGRGARNRPEDVMLAQTLLRILFIENTDVAVRELAPPLPDEPDIVVDGMVGPITQRYIVHFKNCARRAGHALYPDEIMDPFRDNNPHKTSTISKTKYAFALLMNGAVEADQASNLRKFDVLPEHPETHPVLRLALTQTREDALQYGG